MTTATAGEHAHHHLHHHLQYTFPTPLLGYLGPTTAAMGQVKCESDEFPSHQEFEGIIMDYLQNLSAKKRDKALVDTQRYSLILQVLKDPRNTSISTAQFRFWVKKMFQLVRIDVRDIVYHDQKPVATREQIYEILVCAHREAHHGGRDKTSALVRRRYSWIPKELIARFVRHCPFCVTRRNGCASPIAMPPDTPPENTIAMRHQQQQEQQQQQQNMFIMKDPSATAHGDLSHFYNPWSTFQIYDDKSPGMASFFPSYYYSMQPPPPSSSIRSYHLFAENPGASVAAAAAAAAMADTLSHYNNHLRSPSPTATMSSSSGKHTNTSPSPCAESGASPTGMMYPYAVDFGSLNLFDPSSTSASSTPDAATPPR